MIGQMIGKIETPEGGLVGMLCVDEDRPDEWMIHVWGQGNEMAILAKASVEGDVTTLTPMNLFRPAANGNLILPNLTGEEITWMLQTRATLSRQGNELAGTWTGPEGRGGSIKFNIPPSTSSFAAERCDSWDDFKKWAGRVRSDSDTVLYRGHGSSEFQLQTTLHRAGRFRIDRYCGDLLPMFRHHAEAVLNTKFDLNSGDDFATVLGLAQHHGLPTPLLDWTSSPYVAAFFAFADAVDAKRDPTAHDHVRVYALARSFVDKFSPPVVTLPRVQPYVASLAISARLNPRLYAQQGKFLVTNVGLVEGFILFHERQDNQGYLFAIDVPVSLATEALEDLAFMGLTAATMFPGLDGVCRMMRHEMMFKRLPPKAPGKPAGNLEDASTPAAVGTMEMGKAVATDEPS